MRDPHRPSTLALAPTPASRTRMPIDEPAPSGAVDRRAGRITADDLEYLEIPEPVDGAPQGLRRLAEAVRDVARTRSLELRRRARTLARGDGTADAIVAPFRSGRETSYLVLHPGARLTVVESGDDAPMSRDIAAAALVKGKSGRTGLLLRAAERDVCVTGLGAMARLCAALRRDDVPIDFVHTASEPERLFGRIDRLASATVRSLRTWLDAEEFVTDLIEGVRLEGPSTAGDTTLVATSQRAAVLGGNRAGAAPLALPLRSARSVLLEESVTRAGTFYRLRLTSDNSGETAVTLAESHAAILFPLLASRSRYTVQRVDPARA
ncbi:MAG: hypothetical protein AAF957_06770 [Planctomycetota bacterium]